MELNDILSDKPTQTNAEPDLHLKQESPQAELPIESKEEAPVEDKRSVHRKHMEKEYEAQGRNPDGTFKAKEPEEAKPEVKAEPKPEPKAEAKPEAPKVEMTPKEKALLATAQEERQKRQELERQLATFKQQPQQTQQPAQPTQTFWDNPEAALQQFQQGVHQTVQQTVIQSKVAMSADFARRQYADFDEKIAAFGELMQANPWLEGQVASSPNPAEMAYRLGKNRMELQQAGDLDGYRKKVEEETRAAMRKEMEEEAAKKEAERKRLAESLPRSLSDVRGSPPAGSQVWGGPTSLESILKH